ncbi:hypothetical protein BU16DRAFT_164943 [Lophium mytilinum]|uniref:Uncharacterized protein n=1 Tax=Lophium mytilinum TaxID=390894 RepID=A0A6A6QDT6_9PEZI|nr:hypothetical protein BU16DRAFT_164943 [Lophium mytilinum]
MSLQLMILATIQTALASLALSLLVLLMHPKRQKPICRRRLNIRWRDCGGLFRYLPAHAVACSSRSAFRIGLCSSISCNLCWPLYSYPFPVLFSPVLSSGLGLKVVTAWCLKYMASCSVASPSAWS